MNRIIETIREDLTPSQVLAIREKEQQRGRLVNINRIHSALVEIQIIHPDRVINMGEPSRGMLLT
jgi:hypothetical protein